MTARAGNHLDIIWNESANDDIHMYYTRMMTRRTKVAAAISSPAYQQQASSMVQNVRGTMEILTMSLADQDALLEQKRKTVNVGPNITKVYPTFGASDGDLGPIDKTSPTKVAGILKQRRRQQQ